MASLQRAVSAHGAVGYRSPALAALGVPHWFATRGAPGPESGQDLSRLDAAAERRLAAAAGAPEAAVARVAQVHGAGVVAAERVLGAARPPRADAVVARDPRHLALVRAADCVPLLLAAPDGARVAAVHAGWRGVVAGVVPAAVAALGACAAAALGPCISADRFEVGPEVADAFRAAELAEAVVERPGRRPHVDLRRAVVLQLLRAAPGLDGAIDVADACTYRAAELWSYRRDVTHGGAPSTGHQGAAVAPRGRRA